LEEAGVLIQNPVHAHLFVYRSFQKSRT